MRFYVERKIKEGIIKKNSMEDETIWPLRIGPIGEAITQIHRCGN